MNRTHIKLQALNIIAGNAVGFILGTMFGMWLIVFTECFVRGVCR